MQLADVETAFGLVVPDIDDADINQFTREERLDPRARFGIEDVERIVDHHPKRLLQDDAGKSQALLLVVRQLPVPSVHRVEVGLEVFQSDIGERLGDGRNVIDISGVRINDGRAKGARRDVGADRHEHHRLTSRVRDPAAAPGPKPADSAKQQGFFFAISAGDKDALAGIHLGVRFAQHDTAFRRGDMKVVHLNRLILRLGKLDAACGLAEFIHAHDRFSEGRHAQERRAPVGDAGEIVHEPSKRRLHLVEKILAKVG
jgi:hypothetical protein